MSGPDRIWADSRGAGFGGNWGGEGGFCHLTGGTEYVRRDPAVLAALPEVQALIAGVLGQAASMMEDNVRHAAELGREIWPIPDLRTLTPADAIAARDAMIAAERDACIAECQLRAAKHEGDGRHEMMREAELCGDAIRKRGNV